MILTCPICGLVIGNPELHAEWHYEHEDGTYIVSRIVVPDYDPTPQMCEMGLCDKRATWQHNEVAACHEHVFQTDGYLN